LLDQVERQGLDLAVVASSGPPDDVRSRPVGRYRLRHYGRSDRFPTLSRAKRLRELEGYPMVQIEPGPGQTAVLPRASLSTAMASNVSSVKALVLAGFGVG